MTTSKRLLPLLLAVSATTRWAASWSLGQVGTSYRGVTLRQAPLSSYCPSNSAFRQKQNFLHSSSRLFSTIETESSVSLSSSSSSSSSPVASSTNGAASSSSADQIAASVDTAAATALESALPSFQLPLNTQESHLDVEELTQKLTNGLILAASFGYAAYTVLNIDHGMTRGWTQSEIAMRIPLDNWGAYESALQEFPVYTKTMINVVIYLLGDWLSQTVFQRKNVLDFDAGRTFRNGFIGLCFGPLVHEYYQFSDHILPPDGGIMVRLQKIMMDQTIYLTVKCSIYIMAVGLLQGDSWESAAQNVKDRIKSIVFTAWKFWPLVHCITYGVIPARHRILWVNSVDLIWNAILATLSRKTEAEDNVFVAESNAEEDTINEVLSFSSSDESLEAEPLVTGSVVYNERLPEPTLELAISQVSQSPMFATPGNNTVAMA